MIRSALTVAILTLPACSLARSPLAVAVDGGPLPVLDAPLPGLDAPGLDAPSLDPDAPAGTDAPILPIDAPVVLPDAPACVPGCAGSVLTSCAGPPVDCAATGMICVDPPAGPPSCMGMPCVEGTTSCRADGRASVTCTGGVPVPTFCDGSGCDGTTGRCAGTCMVTGEFLPGTMRFDVCGFGSDYVNTTGGECAVGADAEDRMARVVVTRRSRLDAVVRDDDPDDDVDVVLYLRSRCGDPGSQLACDDDVPCAEAADMGGCIRGSQWRQAHITADLEPGVYYLVADSIEDWNEDTWWSCGFVSLTLSLTPI